jgi:hypothetical protein
MDDLLDEVRALKASAKSARDHEAWKVAIGDLQEAIDLLRARMADASLPLPSWLASELADTYGLLGGVEKRWGLLLYGQERQRHLEASVAAYDKGFEYEKDLQRSKANTYNRVNRLVGRVLLNPAVLDKDGGAFLEMADELAEAEEILTRQIETGRQKDPWAYCDLGTIRLLRGEDSALLTFRQLDRLRPQEFVYESTLATLEPRCDLAADLRPDLIRAVTQLRRSAGRSG